MVVLLFGVRARVRLGLGVGGRLVFFLVRFFIPHFISQVIRIGTKGHASDFVYDVANRLQSVTDWLNQTTGFQYDAVNNRTLITPPQQPATEYQYDDLNRVWKIISPNGKFQTFTFDGVGNKLTATDEAGNPTTNTHDRVNRAETMTNALNQVTTYDYDDVGNLQFITEQATGLQTQFEYDSLNRLHFKRTPIGANQWDQTEYLYDRVGNLKTLLQPSGARRTYEYDAANLLQVERLFSDATSLLRMYEYEYDPNHNRTSEVETRYNPSATYSTTRAYDDLDRLETLTDGYGGVTTYQYDEIGDITSITDPSGIAMSIAPRTATTLEVITHTDANQNIVATTTNHYDGSNRLDGWTTNDPVNNLSLTTGLPFNANGYVAEANVSHQGQIGSPSLTSSIQYKDNNLLGTLVQSGQGNRDFEYDSAQRLRCSELPSGNAREIIFYDGSGRREDEYMYGGGTHPCATLAPLDKSYFEGLSGIDHSHFTYEGHRLKTRSHSSLLFAYTDTYGYDGDGNVQTITKVEGSSTITLTYNWEAGTHNLKTFTRTVNGNVTYSATFEYDALNRIRTFCWTGGNCHTFLYVGDSNWLSVVKNQLGATVQRYLYVNGRPLRYDHLSHYQQPSFYFRYNARGDVASFVHKDGNGGTSWRTYGAWGDANYRSDDAGFYSGSPTYYSWNAAWGYMRFPDEMNFDMHGVYDVGLYFAHGRWYNQDTGLWLNPDGNGEYQYASVRRDPVNETLIPADHCIFFLVWLRWGDCAHDPTPTPTPGPTIPPSPLPSPSTTPSRTWTPIPVLRATVTVTQTPTPTWLGGEFIITHYTFALESDPLYANDARVSANGLPAGSFYREGFLYGDRGILLQGTGVAEDGNYITIDWTRGGPNAQDTYFTYGQGGAGGNPVAWETVASGDPRLPAGTRIAIELYPGRIFTVNDTGGAIGPGRIDVFIGAVTIAEADQFGRRVSRVRIVP